MKHLRVYEKTITPTDRKDTMSFWHGGDLDNMGGSIKRRKGRWEYGPGLYMTTHYDTAMKYAGGSRKLYHVIVERGVDIGDVNLDEAAYRDFVDAYVKRSARRHYYEVMSRYNNSAEVFLNVTINNDAIPSTKTDELREFLVANGVDYSLVDNPYGWHEKMMVLFNTDKIVSVERVLSSDTIDTYDLPTDFR